jgi:hypothetical protein
MKAVDYWYAEGDSIVDLARTVRKRINDGWDPIGSICYFNQLPIDRRYIQALIKYASSASKASDDAQIEVEEQTTQESSERLQELELEAEKKCGE